MTASAKEVVFPTSPSFAAYSWRRSIYSSIAGSLNISLSFQKIVISTIKYFFEKVLRRETKSYYFEIPKSKEKKLPIILSKNEDKKILNCTNNLKHKSIFSTIFSAGLRLSEVVNLKITDIDGERKLIYVREGKGKIDRTTILSEK